MKKFVKLGMVLASMALVLTSCDCFKKFTKKADTVAVSCTPTVLTLKGDQVTATFTAEFPAKLFPKKGIAKVTPVLKYDGGEMVGTPKYIQGEKVKDNYQVISYANGGSVTHTVSFPYKPEAKMATLELRFEGKCKNTADFKNANETYVLAEGISTIQLLADDFAELVIAPDQFKRVTTETEEAKIMFLVNQSNVRNNQLNSEDIKTLEKFITDNANKDRRTLSDLYTKAYASPEGPVALNNRLSNERGKNTHTALSRKLKRDKMPIAPKFDVDALGEDWDGFQQLVSESNIPEKDVILQILQMYSDPVKRDQEIKNMSQVFSILKEKILPELRRSKLIMNVDIEGLTDDEIRAAVSSDINSLKLEEMLYAATLYNDNATKEKIYTAVTKNFPKCYRGWNNLGVILAKEGNINGAKNAIAKAANLNASSTEVANNLGVIALYEGNKAEAKKYLSTLNTKEAKYNMGLVYLQEGNYAAAVKALRGYNLAVAETCNGNLVNAKNILSRDNSAKACYLKALIAAKEGNKAAVVSNLDAAVKQNPDYAKQALTEIDFAPYFEAEEFIAVVRK